ncbi:hypothetical protein MTO96_012098, partial [Rhipicephalus appendiculatus]
GENVMKASLVNGLAVIVATVLVASFVAPSQALGQHLWSNPMVEETWSRLSESSVCVLRRSCQELLYYALK